MSNDFQPASLPTSSSPPSASQGRPNASPREALRIASALFRQTPDWVTFFRELLGVDGMLRSLFPTPEAMADFERSDEYRRIQQMVNKLRENAGHQENGREPTKVITVRLPKSLHELLRVEAHDRQTSINKLCISKLLQAIDSQTSDPEPR